jgi:uncharacterized protein YcaQ
MNHTLDSLRAYAVSRSLFAATTLGRAIQQLGFVQADPIRAPARAQDLTLRHRVKHYRAGDLERRYPQLDIEEDFFVNYGFLPRATYALMHPRAGTRVWPKSRWNQAHEVLSFVQARGVVHPKEVDAQFQHGKSRNWFGGTSNASTQLLDGMHYRGLLRIAGRQAGIRLYAAAPPHTTALDAPQAMDALVDVVVRKYAPLPQRTLSELVGRLRYAAPQWADERSAALQRAQQRLACASVSGTVWWWPAQERPEQAREIAEDAVRLLAPFDPVVWDRRRFELLWGWAYRFEAYTPKAKRIRGYYALPLLWRDQVIGWGNVRTDDGGLHAEMGYVSGRAPRSAVFRRGLDEELERLRSFLRAA